MIRRRPGPMPDAGRHVVAQDAAGPSRGIGRRAFLRGAGRVGGTLALLGVGGAAWRIADQGVLVPGTGDAYAAWSADLSRPGPVTLISAAILAANAHDAQPWAFEVSDAAIDVHAVRSRDLGTLDPLLREMELSIGCAVENLVLAARAHGLDPRVTVRPRPGDPDRLVRVALMPGSVVRSPLFDVIGVRRTDRGTYRTDRVVDRTTRTDLMDLVDHPDTALVWLSSADETARFGRLTVDATAAIIADRDQARDDARWYRQDWAEIQRRKDGITLDAAGLEEPVRIASRLLPPSDIPTLHRGWLEATRDRHVATASAFGLIAVRDGMDTAQRVEAGRLYQRLHLAATADGLAMQPLNQVVERVDRERTARLDPTFGRAMAALGPVGWDTVMPFRIGYPTRRPHAAPRRPVAEVTRG